MSSESAVTANNRPIGPIIKPKSGRDTRVMQVLMVIVSLYLVVTLAIPLFMMLSKSFQNADAAFIGLANYIEYFSSPALAQSIWHSLFIATTTMVITAGLGFAYAYAVHRTCMPFKGLFRAIALVPILVPSLLPGIGLIYLFGNQGILEWLLFGHSIYGPLGIIIAEVFYTFPHVIIVIMTALSLADARLYEASEVLHASKLRTFFTVTIPGAKYGVISAAFVAFTLAITDFGAPTVIGAQYGVLAVDIYQQVVGQHDFQMGAVVSVILLVPAAIAFAVDQIMRRKQMSSLSVNAVPYQPSPSPGRDYGMLAFCIAITVFLVGIVAICQYAALVSFWPYNLSLGLHNYNFELMSGAGWGAFYNSIQMGLYTAVFGTILVFTGAYLVEKGRGFAQGRQLFHMLAMMPMAVPGMVLGLSYIFFFNDPDNPLAFLYGSMAILVISTITHFYTPSHLTAATALKQIDNEFESVSDSLRQPFYKMVTRVTVPLCLPAILSISTYLFVNAMTTISAVVFLYSPDTRLASLAVLNMVDSGTIAGAAAMSMVILYTNAAVLLLHAAVSRGLLKRTQAWRVL